ncbi:MAG: hypothetical protein GX825_07145, partial [Syntrophomonadaceae bacterium]|nr:hypothetical protein [Syntrophomonadaceae bacterium]
MIGCPVRERGWILPRYLRCLADLDYPSNQIEYAFVVNDSQDNTLEIIREFACHTESPVEIRQVNLKSRSSPNRGAHSIGNLVVLRNIFLDMFLKSPATHLFSLDSDILVGPDSLTRLIALGLPVVSLLVPNDMHLETAGYFNIANLQGDQYFPITKFPQNQVIPVDCTGAGYLIRREVIEADGGRYHPHRQGEDAGFCGMARAKG